VAEILGVHVDEDVGVHVGDLVGVPVGVGVMVMVGVLVTVGVCVGWETSINSTKTLVQLRVAPPQVA
jgi:hypothetical protein